MVEATTFQFPSNGKAYPKSEPQRMKTFLTNVSIPFKRESLSKVRAAGVSQKDVDTMFQFPSNGKAYPKYGPGQNRE